MKTKIIFLLAIIMLATSFNASSETEKRRKRRKKAKRGYAYSSQHEWRNAVMHKTCAYKKR